MKLPTPSGLVTQKQSGHVEVGGLLLFFQPVVDLFDSLSDYFRLLHPGHLHAKIQALHIFF